jgi:carbonic anhydrase/acetyltransferase-like protein (isoleucine patch superfamily)
VADSVVAESSGEPSAVTAAHATVVIMAIYALGDQVPVIDPTAYIHELAVVIGSVEIGPESSVWPHAVIRGDDAIIRIGTRSNVQDNAVIHVEHEIDTTVGNNVTVGHLAHLEGCRVGNDVLIGTGAIVLPEAEIGDGALVGAGALVAGGTKVPAGAMALGVPAKIREGASRPDLIAPGVQRYVDRGHRYRAELRRIG